MKTRIALTIFWVSLTILLVSTSTNFYLEKFSSINQIAGLAFLALKISLIANFWVFKLSSNDGLFCFVRAFYYSLAESYIYAKKENVMERTQLANDLAKPLFLCEVCVGTHICVWVYAYLSRTDFTFMDFVFLMSATGLITL